MCCHMFVHAFFRKTLKSINFEVVQLFIIVGKGTIKCVRREFVINKPRGEGGGHYHWMLYHISVNRPQKRTLNQDSRGDQKTPLTGDMGQFLNPKCPLLSCLHDHLYPNFLNQDYFHIFIPQP